MNQVLPEGFNGTFYFTNFTDSEFKAKWGGKEYTFPAQKTSPMIIEDATPLQTQEIRKKFAKELAINEFYKTPKFVGMNAVTPGGTPALYTDTDLAPLIQRCLEPLPVEKATVKILPKDSEDNYRKDGKGKNVTRPLEEGESLKEGGSDIVA